MLEVDALNNRLATFGGESRSIGGLLRAQAPIDQGVMNKLE